MALNKIALNLRELEEKKPIKVDIGDNHIMLVLIDGEVYAIDEACSHQGGPLEEGTLQNYTITCPWHGATYDVRTGKGSDDTPWGEGQRSYKVSVDKGSGEISIET